ncbi:hypothetical protein TIFTF001_006040 [Ficus carica]|uniref:Uncharacterized protein n=1 Tax=Ficus carica TaxID=3494 RepID=A0AA88A9K1_FICCA|nr:hypothetical protein TIFTF001_006040 [Ficus carica]
MEKGLESRTGGEKSRGENQMEARKKFSNDTRLVEGGETAYRRKEIAARRWKGAGGGGEGRG